MAQFIVDRTIFSIPEEKLMSYPDSVLAILWSWRQVGENEVAVENVSIKDFRMIVDFYLTGKWPNRYLRGVSLPQVKVGNMVVDAADYFLLPSGDSYTDWSDNSSSTSTEESDVGDWTPSHFGDKDYEMGDFKDRDCLWAERLHDEKMRREDERAEWDCFEDYMDRIM